LSDDNDDVVVGVHDLNLISGGVSGNSGKVISSGIVDYWSSYGG
jgi:hypothetical protein